MPSPAHSLVRSLPPELVQEFDSDELRSLMKAFVKFANQIRFAPPQPESGEEHGFGEDDAEVEAAEGEASVSGGGGEQSIAGTSMTKAGIADASVEVRELGSLFGTLALGSDMRAQLEILESIVAAAADPRAPVGFGDFLALLVHVRAEGARIADARRRTVTDALWDVVVSSLPLAVAGVSEHKARARAPPLRSPAVASRGPNKGAKPKPRAPPAGGIAATADLEESDDDLGSSDDDDAPTLGTGPAGTRAKVAAAERQARRARVALKEGEAARAAAHETRAAIDGFEERAAQARARERAAKAASAHQAAAREHAKAVRRANERGEVAPPPPRAAIAPDDDDGAAESDDEDELLKGSAGGSDDAGDGGVHSASAKDSRAGAIAALGLHWSTEAPRLLELAAARPERVWRRADVMRALRVLSVPALGVTALGSGIACASLATLERLDVSHNKLVSLALGGGDDGVDEAVATATGGRGSPPQSNTVAGLKVLHAYGNEITSLHDMPELPAALMLGLGFNLLQSVSLPLELGTRLAPALCALDLAYNSMCDLDAALHALAGGQLPSQLRQLHLLGNPCALAPRYRSRVLYVLPSLKLLDDLDVTDTEALVAQRAREPPAAPRTVSIGVALSALRAIPFAPANTPPADSAPASKAGGGAKDAKATKGKGKGKDDKPKPSAFAPAPLVDDGLGPRMFVEARVLGAGVEETVTTARVAWSADFVAAAAATDAAVAAAAAAAADQGAAPAPAAHAELLLRPTVPLRDGVRFDGLLLTLVKVTPAVPASVDAPVVNDAEDGTDAPPPAPAAETQTIVGAVRVRLTPLLEPSMNARRAADGVLHERAVLEISPEFLEAERAGLAAAAAATDASVADESAGTAPLPPTEVALSISLNADDAVERSLAAEAVDHARLNLQAGVGIAELSVPLSASASRSVVSGV